VEDSGRRTPDRGLLQAELEEREPGGDRDDGAREHLHQQEHLDLAIDLRQNLDGDLLLRQRRSDDLHHLAPVQVA
jgi:hypothetical protein